ncbi:MAG: ABC transporter substrate-binding protein, partial [Butyrivibrio sp.]|nr:ABC transporter substrate-binding protein [Butyrivibrio sp.]
MCTGVFGCANNGAKEAGAEVSAEAGAEGSSSENASAGTSGSSSDGTAQNGKTDRSGNPIEVPENVETIISMAPSTTQILIDLGLGDKIVACDTYSYGSYLADLKADIPQFDMMTPDQEKIVSLNADVVF